MGPMMDRKEMQPDFLIRVATRAECQQFTPPIRAEVRRLLKHLLAECAAASVASQTDE
jgi:hypothetical protein